MAATGTMKRSERVGGPGVTVEKSWADLREAIAFAESRIVGDADPLNEREAADGQQYVIRILTAVMDSALLNIDPFHPSFLKMAESVRFVGAAGPDIDYDVAIVLPGAPYRISGRRGGASFVGVAVYAHDGDRGATQIVDSVDVDDLVRPDGTFSYEFSHPAAARVIVRQYFHDRSAQEAGSWTIEFTGDAPAGAPGSFDPRPTVEGIEARLGNSAESVRWNARLNQLWSPELRDVPNRFVRQTPDDIVAAITNPDVMYSFTWWRLEPGEALVIEFTPPPTRYWGIQLCDRWFQCFPDRRTNLNDAQVVAQPDGTVRIVLADGDPGAASWLDTSGHHLGVVFFRWLHADPAEQPVCRVVPVTAL